MEPEHYMNIEDTVEKRWDIIIDTLCNSMFTSPKNGSDYTLDELKKNSRMIYRVRIFS